MLINFLQSTIQNHETIDDIIIDFFNKNLGSIGNILLAFICIILACLLSGVIGYERESQGHAAGLRTHILVAAGSALIMYLSIYAFSYDLYPNHDPARLAAQVVAGIGFLGAGTIIKTGVDIRGLTTATTLWVSMAIGLCSGAGRFVVAIIATLITYIVLKFLKKVEKCAAKKTPKLFMVCGYDVPAAKVIKDLAVKHNIIVKNFTSTICEYNGKSALSVVVTIVKTPSKSIHEFGDDLRKEVAPFEIKY